MRKDNGVNFYESSCHPILLNWPSFQGAHKQFIETELKGSCTELQHFGTDAQRTFLAPVIIYYAKYVPRVIHIYISKLYVKVY